MTNDKQHLLFADLLKSRRKRLGLSLDQAANLIDSNATTLSLWENKKSVPRLDLFMKYAQALGFTIEIKNKNNE